MVKGNRVCGQDLTVSSASTGSTNILLKVKPGSKRLGRRVVPESELGPSPKSGQEAGDLKRKESLVKYKG